MKLNSSHVAVCVLNWYIKQVGDEVVHSTAQRLSMLALAIAITLVGESCAHVATPDGDLFNL